MWVGLSVWRGEWLRVWEELSVGGGRGAACVGNLQLIASISFTNGDTKAQKKVRRQPARNHSASRCLGWDLNPDGLLVCALGCQANLPLRDETGCPPSCIGHTGCVGEGAPLCIPGR